VFTVFLDSEGALHLPGGEVLTESAAHAALQALARSSPGAAVHLKADRSVHFDRVSAALDLVRRAGFERVALIAAN
jgi:biopolymer transport protein ExbD